MEITRDANNPRIGIGPYTLQWNIPKRDFRHTKKTIQINSAIN